MDSLHVKELNVGTITTRTSSTESGATKTRTGQAYSVPAKMGQVGATSGWATNVDTAICTLDASQSGSTFVVPLPVKIGDIITGFTITGQIESAGMTVTIDADLRATTAVSGGSTDASIGSITQISKTADYQINDTKSGLSHTVITGNTYYVLVTGTTGITTDVELLSIEVTVTEK